MNALSLLASANALQDLQTRKGAADDKDLWIILLVLLVGMLVVVIRPSFIRFSQGKAAESKSIDLEIAALLAIDQSDSDLSDAPQPEIAPEDQLEVMRYHREFRRTHPMAMNTSVLGD